MSELKIFPYVLLVATCGVTLIVNPWTSLDPINLPKMSLLVVCAVLLIPLVLNKLKLIWAEDRKILIILGAALMAVLASVLNSRSSLNQQIWGVWGRNTGGLTLVSLFILFAAGYIFSKANGTVYLIVWLQRTSYFVTIYSILQIGKVDPINWSQKATVATLGNINFVSAFLGFANATFFVALFDKKSALSSKINHAFFLLLNLFVIFYSQSIQGLAISAAGFTVWFFFRLLAVAKQTVAYIVLITNLAVGTIVLLGTMGIGPLGRILVQDSVVFRLDYWAAGLEMYRAEPIFGLGIDSYGDYYRQYRTEVAVTRTGPGRVSNTAHNVFIDWASGGGTVLIVPILLLILLGLYRNWRTLLSAPNNQIALNVLVVLVGWIVFLSISINQIGVTVWGFVFLGAACSQKLPTLNDLHANKSKKMTFKSPASVQPNMSKLDLNGWLPGYPQSKFSSNFLKVLSFFFGMAIIIPPLSTDIKFLGATKERNLSSAERISSELGATSFHLEMLVTKYVELEDQDSALRVARALVRQYPRNFWGWSIIALNPASTAEERSQAKQVLLRLDPKNESARNALEGIGQR